MARAIQAAMRRPGSPTEIACFCRGNAVRFPLLLLLGCSGGDRPMEAPSMRTLPPLSSARPATTALAMCATQFSAGAPTLAGDHRSLWGDDAHVYVAGAAGEILRLDADVAQSVPVTTPLNVVFAASASDVYAAGDGGVVLRSNGDGNWRKMDAPGDVDYLGGWASGSEVFLGGASMAVTHGGLLVHSGDGGATWEQSTIGATSTTSRPLWFTQLWGMGDIFAVGAWHLGLENTSILYRFSGGAWSPVDIFAQPLPPSATSPGHELYSIWGAGGTLYLGGAGSPFGSGGILRYQNGLFTGEDVPLTDPAWLTGVDPVRALWGPTPLVAASGKLILTRPSIGAPWCIAAVAAGNVAALWGPPGAAWFYAAGDFVQRISVQ